MKIEYKRLGKSGVKVSNLCLGTMNFGSKVDETTAIKIVKRAFDLGINFFDTANEYNNGKSEKVLGNAIRGMRDELVVATKVRHRMGAGPNDEGLSRKHIMRAANESLKRLGTDHIDIYYAHRPSNVAAPDEPIRGFVGKAVPMAETMRALTDLVRAGKVLYLGCSNFPAWLLCKSLWVCDSLMLESFSVCQPKYNLLNREIEREIIPLCADQDIGIVPYSPLGGGVLTGKYKVGAPPPVDSRGATDLAWFKTDGWYWEDPNIAKKLQDLEELPKELRKPMNQIALAWLLANPIVTSVIIGAASVQQLEENVAATDLILNKTDLDSINHRAPALGAYWT